MFSKTSSIEWHARFVIALENQYLHQRYGTNTNKHTRLPEPSNMCSTYEEKKSTKKNQLEQQ